MHKQSQHKLFEVKLLKKIALKILVGISASTDLLRNNEQTAFKNSVKTDKKNNKQVGKSPTGCFCISFTELQISTK